MRHFLPALIAMVLLCSLSRPVCGAPPVTGRLWTYQSVSILAGEHLGISIIPGTRYEWYRSGGTAKEFYFNEFFIGPMFFFSLGKMRMVVPVWYYYMGFPVQSDDTVITTHNLAVAPILSGRIGGLGFYTRLFFHNTLYTDLYTQYYEGYGADSKTGFSTLMTWKAALSKAVFPKLSLTLANELFTGLIENEKVPAVTGSGFSEKGYVMNRTFVGLAWTIRSGIAACPEYVYERSRAGGSESTGHYLLLTMRYTINCREK